MLPLFMTTPMRAFFSTLFATVLLTAQLLIGAGAAHARDSDDAEDAVVAMAAALEKEGYQFRAELWSAPMKDDVGRAVRVQMFKGLEYQFCIAVSPAPATGFSALLLDFEGKPFGKTRASPDGKSVILTAKPKKTGVYAVAMRQTGPGKTIACALLTGWK